MSKNYNKIGKFRVFGDILDKYFEGQKISVLEYGRLRNAKRKARHTDGWSTFELSRRSEVIDVYSLDINEETIAICKKLIPARFEKKVHYAKNVKDFGNFRVDILFLDADNDPKQCMRLYKEGEQYLKSHGVVLIDDVFDKKGKKGDILIQYLEKQGYEIERFHPFALIRK